MATINYAAKEISVKIVYYGPALSGKTTNLQIIHRKIPTETRTDMVSLATETDRTLFFDFLPLDLGKIKGFTIKFQLYTVPGQVYYNATRKLVLRGVDGIAFVADSSAKKYNENIESFQNLENNLAEYGYKRENIPTIIQYNKRDMPDALPIEELNRMFNKYNLPYSEAVANKGKGVFESLKIIGKVVVDQLSKKYTSTAKPQAPKVARPVQPPPVQQPVQPEPVQRVFYTRPAAAPEEPVYKEPPIPPRPQQQQPQPQYTYPPRTQPAQPERVYSAAAENKSELDMEIQRYHEKMSPTPIHKEMAPPPVQKQPLPQQPIMQESDMDEHVIDLQQMRSQNYPRPRQPEEQYPAYPQVQRPERSEEAPGIRPRSEETIYKSERKKPMTFTSIDTDNAWRKDKRPEPEKTKKSFFSKLFKRENEE